MSRSYGTHCDVDDKKRHAGLAGVVAACQPDCRMPTTAATGEDGAEAVRYVALIVNRRPQQDP